MSIEREDYEAGLERVQNRLQEALVQAEDLLDKTRVTLVMAYGEDADTIVADKLEKKISVMRSILEL